MATQYDHADFKLMIDLIALQNDNTTFILLALFNKEPRLSALLSPWSQHMETALLQHVRDFIKLWEIDLTNAQVWDIEPSRKVIVAATNQTPTAQAPAKKPFWKIW
jgi:hypothetical protein